MSWLKKGPVFTILGAALTGWALVFFLFDPLLKRALIAGGQAAAGAKVEIASLSTKWLKGSLEIRGLAVADREAPMTNLVEFSRAAFRLDMSAAVRGAGVVREAAIEGVRLGAPRRTSGALHNPPPPSKLEAAVRAKIAPVAGKAVEVKSNASGEVDAAKLQGLAKMEEAKAKAKEIEERWKGKQAEVKAIEAEARQVADEFKALGKGGSGPADILRKAQAAKQAQDKLKALLARVDAQKKDAQKDLAEAQALLREAEELRKKDLNGLLAAAGLPTLDSQDLARRLLGAQTASRLATALKWTRWAREQAAARKAANPPPPPRRRGVDISFPRKHAYPALLVEGAKLSGTLDGVMGGSLDLAGLLNGVTSEPALYGKPALLELGGKSAAGPAVRLAARLDQQLDPVGVTLELDGSGFSLAGTTLGDGEVGGALTAGRAAVRGRLTSRGEEWTGEVVVDASGVVLEPKVALTGLAGTLVADALKSLTGFQVRIGISGTEDDLKLAFSSNAGDAVAAAMKKALAGQLEAQKKALEAKLAAIYGDKAKDAESAVGGLAGKLLGPLDAQKAALDRQIKESLGAGAQPLRLDRLFKR